MDDGAGDYHRPAVERRAYNRSNSTSTVKVSTTMSHPNNNSTIMVIANKLYKLLQADRKQPPFGTRFDLSCFNDPLYANSLLYYSSDSDGDSDVEEELVLEEKSPENNINAGWWNQPPEKTCNRQDSDKENAIVIDSREDPVNRTKGPLQEFSSSERRGLQREFDRFSENLPLPPVVKPTPAMIREYLRNIFTTAQCSEECNIICLIYVRRLLEYSGNATGLNPYNWKAIIMTALLLASKVWDDLSMVNEDFSIFMPYSLNQINSWEVDFLSCLQFNVRVSVSEYTEIYFDLRKEAQVCGYELLPNKEVDIKQATKLEALTSTMEKRAKAMHSYNSAPQDDNPAMTNTEETRLRRAKSDAGPRPPICRYVID